MTNTVESKAEAILYAVFDELPSSWAETAELEEVAARITEKVLAILQEPKESVEQKEWDRTVRQRLRSLKRIPARALTRDEELDMYAQVGLFGRSGSKDD
jgi:hypothetical protein